MLKYLARNVYKYVRRLRADDSGGLACDGHGPCAAAGARCDVDTDVALSRLSTSLGIIQHLLSLAVLVHCYRHHFLLYTYTHTSTRPSFTPTPSTTTITIIVKHSSKHSCFDSHTHLLCYSLLWLAVCRGPCGFYLGHVKNPQCNVM